MEDIKNNKNEIEYVNVYFVIFKFLLNLIVKISQCVLWVAITMLEWFINLLKELFLKDFKLFNFNKDDFLHKVAKKEINREKVKFTTERLTSHVYEFERSVIYNAVYKELQTNLKDFTDNEVVINDTIYKDILNKINILTVEVEKKALEEGYSYAAYTKYRFNDQEEIYNNFIEFKVMRGEGHGKNDTKYRASQD